MDNFIKINSVLEKLYAHECDSFAENVNSISFKPSERFMNNMAMLIDGVAAPRTSIQKRVIKRRIAVLAAAVILIAALALGSYAARDAIGSFFVKSFSNKESIIYFSAGELPTSFNVELTYIPERFSFKDEQIEKRFSAKKYEDLATLDGFSCICTLADNTVLDVSTELGNYMHIKLSNGCDAVLYENDELRHISFFCGKILCSFSGELTREEIINLANGAIFDD